MNEFNQKLRGLCSSWEKRTNYLMRFGGCFHSDIELYENCIKGLTELVNVQEAKEEIEKQQSKLTLEKYIIVYRDKLSECAVSSSTRGKLLWYIVQGKLPGKFLRTILENDLDAVVGWSTASKELIWSGMDAVIDHCPSEAWGDVVKVQAWINLGGLLGQAEQEKNE